MRNFGLCVVVLSLAAALSAVAHAQRAILVGVSHFDYLSVTPLEGPPNDVALMAAALTRRGISSSKVVAITDAARPHLLPTRANILRVLREQARATKAGEVVVIYFSGHGAQVPQAIPVAAGNWVEPDGLDEVFLTRDTKLWDRSQQKVEGALLDDEIGAALARFTNKGARVWAIFDTCHAGDMARTMPASSSDSTIWRGVNAVDLGVSVDEVMRAGHALPTNRVVSQKTVGSVRTVLKRNRGTKGAKGAPGELIVFYASQADEAAPEQLFSRPAIAAFATTDKSDLRFGVFTWALVDAWDNSAKNYGELVHRIERRYAARSTPTPVFVGPLHRDLP